MSGQRFQRLAAVLAALALAVYTLVRFRGAVLTFYFLDDFWVMRDAARVQVDSLWDIGQFFRTGHAGFLLYRPLSTTIYAYLLNALFGYDSSGYHAFQLLVMALNVVLVYAITRRLTQSIAAAFAVGLLYVLAPGQAVNAYWLSAFTVTGTAVWVLLMMWAWLAIESPRWRAAVCALLQVAGLLASEHAITGPILLAILSLTRREPWRAAATALAPGSVPVAIYLIAKLWYLAGGPRMSAAYSVAFNPLDLVRQLGQYFSACFNVLKLWPLSDGASLALGATLVALLVLAAWRSSAGHSAWRILAAGIALFAVSLAPVIVLRAHYYDHYICLAALGAALAIIGLCEILTVYWRPLALAVALAVLALDLFTAERAWRQNQILKLVVSSSHISASWVATAQQAAGLTLFVPADAATGSIFIIGQVQTYFPRMPKAVRRFNAAKRRPIDWPGRHVAMGAQPIPMPSFAHPYPEWDPRWDWLRRLAGAQ